MNNRKSVLERKSVLKNTTLSSKQQRFVDEYLKDTNATQAAIRAGYSAKTAQPQSSRLLSHVIISKAIEKGQAETAKRNRITVDDLLRELEEARLVALKAMTPQASAAVSATMGKAKLLGLDTQLIDLTSSDGSMSPIFNIVGVSPDDTSASSDGT